MNLGFDEPDLGCRPPSDTASTAVPHSFSAQPWVRPG